MIAASKSGHLDVVKYLIDKGADIDARNNGGESALMLAAKGGHFDAVKYLLSRGADINARNKEDQTALILASSCDKAHLDLVKYLVDNGAEIDIKDNKGRTVSGRVPYGKAYSEVKNYLAKIESEKIAGTEFLKRLAWITILGVLIMALSQYLVSSYNPIQRFYSGVSILYKIVVVVALCILIGVAISSLSWLGLLLRRIRRKKKIYKKQEDESKRLRNSGMLTNFVREKNGLWDHNDWLSFLSSVHNAGYRSLPDDQVGRLLEEEKHKFNTGKIKVQS